MSVHKTWNWRTQAWELNPVIRAPHDCGHERAWSKAKIPLIGHDGLPTSIMVDRGSCLQCWAGWYFDHLMAGGSRMVTA